MKDSGSATSDRRDNPPYRYQDGRVVLILRVQPGAASTEWGGSYGGRALRLKVAAPALDGKANRVLLRFLAKTFGVAPSRVVLNRGEHARTKTVTIHNVTLHRWKAFFTQWESA